MDTSVLDLPDLAAFSSDLARDDDLGAVVRAHIWIENCLVSIVEQQFVAPRNLGRMGLEFDDYVSLALALGVADEWGPSLRALGSTRNGFAHKLDVKLDFKVSNNLYNCIPPEAKAQVHAMLSKIRQGGVQVAAPSYFDLPAKDQFQLVVMVMWIAMRALQVQKPGANVA